MLSFPRWVAPARFSQEPLAELSPAVIHVRQAIEYPAAPVGVDPDSAQIALQRDAIERGREELRADVVKLMVQGWDDAERLTVVRKLDAEIAQLGNASSADIGKRKDLERLEQTRRRTVQEALAAMAKRIDAGELLTPPSTFTLRSDYHRQLANAQTARTQRHTVLRLAEADAAAQRKIDELDGRMIELDGQRVPPHRPPTPPA